MAELVTFPLSSALVDLKKRLPKVWCPNCEAVQPMEFTLMPPDNRNDHDAADILCGICRFVVATLHA
jgi:hypothetical protein